jgi:hypothetical protein
MTALAQGRQGLMERWTYHLFTLTEGYKAWAGGQCFLDPNTGKVRPGGDDPDLLYIGIFHRTEDATEDETQVNVNLGMEIEVRWWANDNVSPVAATDVGKLCYSKDDQTATMSAAGNSLLGRIWAVSTEDGVAVQKLESSGGAGGGAGGEALLETLTAFASNNIDVGPDPVNKTTYDIPATAAASTVTLPAAADEGTRLTFSADGVKNGHTVTYRDGDGNVAITGALTASKRHVVDVLYLDGSWRANAFVSP